MCVSLHMNAHACAWTDLSEGMDLCRVYVCVCAMEVVVCACTCVRVSVCACARVCACVCVSVFQRMCEQHHLLKNLRQRASMLIHEHDPGLPSETSHVRLQRTLQPYGDYHRMAH